MVVTAEEKGEGASKYGVPLIPRIWMGGGESGTILYR